MVVLDYLFDAVEVASLCARSDLLLDDGLDRSVLMPLRLEMNGVEVLGVGDDFHRGNPHRRDLPSQAWTPVEILEWAFYALPVLGELREVGHTAFGCDPGVAIELRGNVVHASFDGGSGHVGEATLEEFERALVAFASRVRQDFIRVCPRLCDHRAYGAWYRGEVLSVDWEAVRQQGMVQGGSPSDPISLPSAQP